MSNHHQSHHAHSHHHQDRTAPAPATSNYANRLLSRMLNDRKKPDKPAAVGADAAQADNQSAEAIKR
ncbi:MAG TPA: hypothetical protein V6C81_20975 [Planktothrix sp.]|jgi:hypothetical protein